jgi:hypothetical protein
MVSCASTSTAHCRNASFWDFAAWHALSKSDQRIIAECVVEHLRRCRWQFTKPEFQLGPSPMSRGEPPSE